MKYPDHSKQWHKVLFVTADKPDRWRKGMFYWNGTTPTFASYGSTVSDVIDWKYTE